MSGRLTNVTLFVPDDSVESLRDEIEKKSVKNAVQAVVTAYAPFDSDGQIPQVSYNTDLAGALRVAVREAEGTEGDDLLVIITDGVTDDREAVEDMLDQLTGDGNGVVLVEVNDQPNDDVSRWLKKLDGDGQSDKLDRVDVLKVEQLPGTEVQGWFQD